MQSGYFRIGTPQVTGSGTRYVMLKDQKMIDHLLPHLSSMCLILTLVNLWGIEYFSSVLLLSKRGTG
jgi:mannose/fructose/N-acetylgalactosamine-specific phosphotransferase system component IID